MSRLLGVSPSGYYAWRNRPRCKRGNEDDRLRQLIVAIHARSRGTYGVPRIRAELRFDHDVRCSGKRVRRLMQIEGIQGRRRRRRVRTTWRSIEAAPAPDLMLRRFVASRPDEAWVGDIKYIRTLEGFLYLAGITDVFTRGMVGWSMSETLHTQLVLDALDMAIRRRRPELPVIHHSDQGSTPALPSRDVCARPASHPRWAAAAMRTTTLSPRASGRRSTASCSPEWLHRPQCRADGHLRIHRRLVQSAPPPLLAGLLVARRIRASVASYSSPFVSYDHEVTACPRKRVKVTRLQPPDDRRRPPRRPRASPCDYQYRSPWPSSLDREVGRAMRNQRSGENQTPIQRQRPAGWPGLQALNGAATGAVPGRGFSSHRPAPAEA